MLDIKHAGRCELGYLGAGFGAPITVNHVAEVLYDIRLRRRRWRQIADGFYDILPSGVINVYNNELYSSGEQVVHLRHGALA